MSIKKRIKKTWFRNRPHVFSPHDKAIQTVEWQRWLLKVRSFFDKTHVNYVFSQRAEDVRPHLEIEIFGKRIVSLLDSGATRSIIGKSGWEILQDLGVTVDNELSTECFVADGSPSQSIGSVRLPVKLKDQVRVINFLVVPNFKPAVILGVDFWTAMNITTNIHDGTWDFSPIVCTAETQAALVNQRDLSPAQLSQLNTIIDHHFCKMGNKLGCTNLVEHKIITDAEPIKQRYYPVSPKVQEHVNIELNKMLADGVVEPSNSPWSSPILLVRKPDNSYRFVVDYRKVNAVTRKDAYPLPFVNAILDRLRDARYLTSLELKSAYWQVPLSDSSKPITAFTVPGRGLFQFNRMPFGLHNAPATWQRLMDRLFGVEFDQYVFVYLDDIIIISPTFEKHLEILEKILSRISNAGLTLNREKCKFCLGELKYLGYVINKNGLQVDPDKISAILKIPVPRSVSDVRRFVGVASWYRRFIPNFSSLTAPLTGLLKKTHKWVWSQECEDSFNCIKERLVSAPILNCPNFDFPFIVQTDASGYGIGAVLTQRINENERVISYASRTLNKAERNYTTTERELLAVLFAVEKFRPYLEASKFKVITDHHSLVWLNNLKDPVGRLARWAVRLQQYDFEVVHRKASELVVPDLLSRAVTEEINLVTIDAPVVDPWYRQLKENIVSKPHDYSRWKLENEMIFKQVYSPAAGTLEWKLVIPKEKRLTVLQECHDIPTSGHCGVFKTLYRAKQLYYWLGMRSDTSKYVQKCKFCQINKPILRGAAGLMGRRPNIGQPWQLISTDLMDFPRSVNGYKYLLVVTDYFSKFSCLFPLRKATSSTVAQVIEEQVFLLYGVPQFLICDNGPQFVGKEFKKLSENYQVKLLYNAHYHPQNNPTERVNQVIKRMIRSYLKDDHKQWDRFLKHIQCAINTSSHEVTQQTPFLVNFGREHNLSGKYFGKINNGDPVPNVDLPTPLPNKLPHQDLFQEIRRRLQQSYEKSGVHYNLRRRNITFEPGQQVWRKNYSLSDASKQFAAKLAPKFIGPFIIKRKTSSVTYELATNTGKSIGIWHVKDLKEFLD